MDNLTDEQKALLAEVEEKEIIRVNSRKNDWSEENQSRKQILKSLVYLNLVAFDVDFTRQQILFLSRKKYPNFP